MPTPPEHSKFKPGESGNPNGRPKKLPELDKLLADVLGEEKDGIDAAKAILMALRSKATKGDVRAAELILNRAYGKPKERVEMQMTVEKPIQIIQLPDNGRSNTATEQQPE